MNKIKLTINRVCFFFYSMLLVGIFAIVIITYKITNNILPVLCCILFAIFISFNMLVPFLCYKKMAQKTVVERLRIIE